MASKNKEPGILRKIVEIHYEQAKRRRAIRQLAKLEWSYEFLVAVIQKAARDLDKNIVVQIETPSGNKLSISSVKDANPNYVVDDDIFNKLDDQAAVESFIREHSPRS